MSGHGVFSLRGLYHMGLCVCMAMATFLPLSGEWWRFSFYHTLFSEDKESIHPSLRCLYSTLLLTDFYMSFLFPAAVLLRTPAHMRLFIFAQALLFLTELSSPLFTLFCSESRNQRPGFTSDSWGESLEWIKNYRICKNHFPWTQKTTTTKT